MATPTSDSARPNPKSTAARIAGLASFITVNIIWNSVAPKDRAVSLICGPKAPIAAIVRPIIIGMISMVWPKAIPVGVKSRFRLPSGPVRESSRKTNRPTVTVGKL